MIDYYLIVSCLIAIAGWPIALTLINLSAGGSSIRDAGLSVILVVLFILATIVAWQPESYSRITLPHKMLISYL
ncbi:hypothetical protein CFY86_03855 [Raoultella ornithinolytica]|uniref:Uncharacterized protein n=1 Tax=Raoultella ornithinolytica TaxID=54291 RepID=A0A855FC40_RAOOR|nr:hypothetical protein CFY86_03855 [Raoultella ornithinolytica]